MKKRGFTLVELLAVIVIISIIALITVPIIFGLINDSKKSAAKNSFKSYMRQIEDRVLEKDIDYEEENFPQPDNEGCYKLVDIDEIVDIKGEHPEIAGEKKVCFSSGKLTYLHSVIINGYEIWYDGEIHINKEGDENPDDPPSYMPTDEAPDTTVTTKSIRVINRQEAKIGQITEIEYAIKKKSDSNWGQWKAGNINEGYYEFDGLERNTDYQVKTRIKTTRKKEFIESKIKEVKTGDIPLPTFIESGDTSKKTVKITYGSGYTNSYSTDGGKTWIAVTKNSEDVPFTENGTVIARSSDGKNEVRSSHTVDGIIKGVGIPTGTYTPGSTVRYAGLDWLVIKDNGDTTTLILKNNYKTGSYGTSTSFASGNNAYTQVNTNFVNQYETIKNDITNEMIIRNSDTNSYVRLPKKDELSDKIPNGSGTNFWTLTSTGNNMYYGVPNGSNTYTSYSISGSSGPYYSGYSMSSLAGYYINTYSSTSNSAYTLYNATSGVYSNYIGSPSCGYASNTSAVFTPGNSASVSSLTSSNYFSSLSCALYDANVSRLYCGYSCSPGSSPASVPFSEPGGSGDKNYCGPSGTLSFNYSYPSVSGTAYGSVEYEPSYASTTGSCSENYTETDVYGNVNILGCKKLDCQPSITRSGYFTGKFKCSSGCSANTTGSTYYYATPDSCSNHCGYSSSIEKKYKDMGIRPVITIKEK